MCVALHRRSDSLGLARPLVLPRRMSEQSEHLKDRTMTFAVSVLRLIDLLPRTPGGQVVGRQLAKCSTSVAANYRAACIARSKLEFVAKLHIVLEEAEESLYWLELITRARLLSSDLLPPMQQEANELRSIFARSFRTARFNLKNRQ